MSAFTVINLERLPVPAVVEKLDFEAIFQAHLADFKVRAPEYSAIVESDPVYKLIEAFSYRELILRARVNDAARSLMIAYAMGTDLEHLGAIFGVERLVIVEADNTVTPPVEAVLETDSRYRYRIQLALEAFTTAGSRGSYEFWSLSASGDVKDVDINSPIPGQVDVTVLSLLGDGTPDQALIDLVYATLSAEDVRPITDYVVMHSPEILPYSLEANIYTYAGPDPIVVRQAAVEAVTNYVTEHHLLGHDIEVSGLYAALHQPGVQKVDLISPANGIEVASQQAAFCQSVTVNYIGVDE